MKIVNDTNNDLAYKIIIPTCKGNWHAFRMLTTCILDTFLNITHVSTAGTSNIIVLFNSFHYMHATTLIS